MGTRHLSLLEQKKMQWAKEREEMAGLCTPWGPAERVRPLRKRLAPNFEDPDEDFQNRNDESSVMSSMKEIPANVQPSTIPTDGRGRTPQREKTDIDSHSPSLPPVNQNILAEERKRPYYQKDVLPEKHETFEGYLYLNENQGLSKSTENFSISDGDPRAKRKQFLSGDRVVDSGSLEKISADRSPYSLSYQNSNLSLATEGDTTWREWGMGRGNMDEMRPRWGDRGINTGHPWNSGGPTPVGRMGDNSGPPEDYPAPGWVERGLSRMSSDGRDGRGRGGSAESLRCDPGIRVVVSDENGGVQRMRGSLSELQNVAYVPGSGVNNEMYSQRNYDGYSSALPYVGELSNVHSSAGMHHRPGGSVIEGGRGERVIVVGRDVYNASDIHSRSSYGYNGCISAPNNKPLSQKFKKNDEVTSSLPNLQCNNTHLRGQNVPVDPEVVVERELRRLKAMELQKAIRQQLEEREKRRFQEREQRLKEERDIEDRLRQQQEAERIMKEEEDKKHREKEEMENRKAEIMKEALEVAEKEAQKQRKKRSVHKMDGKVQHMQLSTTPEDYSGAVETTEQVGNYIVSSCCPVVTEGVPNPLLEAGDGPLDNIQNTLPVNLKLESSVTSGGRVASEYREIPYHAATSPAAPFKISIPESSMISNHGNGGGEGTDPRQGGVLIVGRDVYLLPYVNTDTLAPRHMGYNAYTLGTSNSMENIGNGILRSSEHCDYRRDWIGSTQRVRPSRDVGTQTEPNTQGPLLLLLRMAGPEDSQNGSDQRSNADDSSTPENELKDSKGKSLSADAVAPSADCCFCQKTSSQSQPSCLKSSSQDCLLKQPQQLDQRPKWGANRPARKYTTQSEKDPHYSCRNSSQKRQSLGRSKREAPEIVTTEEGSEDQEQAAKPIIRVKSKTELQTGATNASSFSASGRNPTSRKKGQGSNKMTEKSSETGESCQQSGAQVSQSPLPVLASQRTTATRRVQVVKPSLSLDQDLIGPSEYQSLEGETNRSRLSYYTPQLSPMQMFPDCKHLPPPVLPPLQRSSLSPMQITQTPMTPIRLSPSPTPSAGMCPNSMPQIRSPRSPMPSSRHTQTPLPPPSPTPTYQPPPMPQSSRHCGSPPVPAVLAKMRREQAKSPPRQFSFISTAPDREKPPPPPPQTRKEPRSGTPSLKPQTPSSKVHTPRTENKNTIVLITPNDEISKKNVVLKPLSALTSPVVENGTFLTTSRDETPVRSPSNYSCPTPSSARDNSNALMMVTSTEDISIGSPVPNPLLHSLSMIEVDENGSIVLVTPSDEISVGLDTRTNNSVSRGSQISAEGIPDGFWEDLGSSIPNSSSQAEASVAASLPEDAKIESKTKKGVLDESMKKDDELSTPTRSDELENNIGPMPKSPDTFSIPQKTESEKKPAVVTIEKGRSGDLKEDTDDKSEKIISSNSLVKNDVEKELETLGENEEKPHQTPRRKALETEEERTENQEVSGAGPGAKTDMDAVHTSQETLGEKIDKRMNEEKGINEHVLEGKRISPSKGVEIVQEPKQAIDDSVLEDTSHPDEIMPKRNINEEADALNALSEVGQSTKDDMQHSFSNETVVSVEMKGNYSNTQEKTEEKDGADPEGKRDTLSGVRVEKEIDTSQGISDLPREVKSKEGENLNDKEEASPDHKEKSVSESKELGMGDAKNKPSAS